MWLGKGSLENHFWADPGRITHGYTDKGEHGL
jgi:hypothetical protein